MPLVIQGAAAWPSSRIDIQAKTIPAILSGRDLIGLAQTGTGKTAAFTLPLLSQLVENNHELTERAARVLIIAPTRELVQQINESIRTYGKFTNLRTAIVMGGASERHQIEKLRSNVDIVIATPGRLMALMEAGHTNFGKLTHLVLDEADRMLDMGFLPDIQEITKSLPKRRQSLLFSATFPRGVETLALEWLHEPSRIEIEGTPEETPAIEQRAIRIDSDKRTPLLRHLLEAGGLLASAPPRVPCAPPSAPCF